MALKTVCVCSCVRACVRVCACVCVCVCVCKFGLRDLTLALKLICPSVVSLFRPLNAGIGSDECTKIAHILRMSMPFSFQGPQLDLRLTWAGASTPEADINVYVPIASIFLFNEVFVSCRL